MVNTYSSIALPDFFKKKRNNNYDASHNRGEKTDPQNQLGARLEAEFGGNSFVQIRNLSTSYQKGENCTQF